MNVLNNKLFNSLLALLILVSTPVTLVKADAKGEVGILTCDYIEGSKVNLLIHSSASFNCVFEHSGEKEPYDGEAGIGLGLDLQWTNTSKIAYSVIATTGASIDWSTALNGTYTGGKASAALGVGVGAAVLIGGDNDNIGLVPLALEGSTGIGASAGVGYVSLKAK
ncbi:MAG: DUF992 domain-containing protein [Proteobacteria bacterium]|nr:DUF992 domain-containing protein [Pseudomonadota bacterium]